MWYLLAMVTVFGHWALCIWTVNRLHATALPYRFVKFLDKVWYLFLFGVPTGIVGWLVFRPTHPLLSWERIGPFALAYSVVCVVSVIATAIVWGRYLAERETTKRLVSNHDRVIDVAETLGYRPTGTAAASLLAALPGNQVFEVNVNRKTVVLPRLPQDLEGVSITHISDLHFTGRMAKPFYEAVVEQVNAIDSDVVAVTGDIIDKPHCLPWLPDVLGKLHGRHGVFFVLGNHDLRIRDEMAIRNSLARCGHHDLGGRWQIEHIRGWPVFFAGNELPWFPRATNMRECPSEVREKQPVRILLSHSPDQIEWARAHQFDLMLAGHTHGGQIRFPGIGPVFAPSRYGVRFASGTFYLEPTLMHVSRGLAGCRPIRFNCRPEITQLVLKSESNWSNHG